jgi:hypothetical protein
MNNINIDIDEFKTLIRDIIKEELDKYIITEMAYNLSDYKNKVDNLIPQIIENWCLIRYTTLSRDKMELRKHWLRELNAHLYNISLMKLVNGNKSTTKRNALYSLWNRRDIDTDENIIGGLIYLKFEDEGIPTKGEIFAQIVSDFKNATKDIINVILSNNLQNIKNYTNNI